MVGLFHDLPEAVARQRLDGFREALGGRGRRPPPGAVVIGLGSVDEARDAVHRLVDGDDQPPTAIVTSGPAATTGALQALTERGLRRAVAHVALDDLPGADLLDPALTVVRYDVSRLGAVAAELLLERVAGHGGRPRRVVLQPSLVQRGSGEVPPPAGSSARPTDPGQS